MGTVTGHLEGLVFSNFWHWTKAETVTNAGKSNMDHQQEVENGKRKSHNENSHAVQRAYFKQEQLAVRLFKWIVFKVAAVLLIW